MAIVDIQIAPQVLSLEPATRRGRFNVQVANQLGRDGRFQVSLLPVADAKPAWLVIDPKWAQLGLKKDETAVFDVEVSVPPDVAPGRYGFRVRCAEELDPANVKADSEQRDFVVAPAVEGASAPPWRKWLPIAVGGAALIAGLVVLAIVLTGKKCDPPCAAGQACEDGQCVRSGPDGGGHAVDAGHRPKSNGGCIEGAGSAPCGQCGGVLECDGGCSKAMPTDLGRTCNACGGKKDCQGNCTPALRPGFGNTCNACGGKIDCQGACTPPMPPDFGKVTVKYHVSWKGAGGSTVGGPCDPGNEIADATAQSGGGFAIACSIVSRGSGRNCTAVVGKAAVPPFIQSECEIVITQRRVCN